MNARITPDNTTTNTTPAAPVTCDADSNPSEEYKRGYDHGARDSRGVSYNSGYDDGHDEGYSEGWNDHMNSNEPVRSSTPVSDMATKVADYIQAACAALDATGTGTTGPSDRANPVLTPPIPLKIEMENGTIVICTARFNIQQFEKTGFDFDVTKVRGISLADHHSTGNTDRAEASPSKATVIDYIQVACAALDDAAPPIVDPPICPAGSTIFDRTSSPEPGDVLVTVWDEDTNELYDMYSFSDTGSLTPVLDAEEQSHKFLLDRLQRYKLQLSLVGQANTASADFPNVQE